MTVEELTAENARLKAENALMRDGIAYVVSRHPYGRLRALMDSVLAGRPVSYVSGEATLYNSRLDRAEDRARMLERKLESIKRAIAESIA